MNAARIPASLAGLATLALVPALAFAAPTETTTVYRDGSSQTVVTDDEPSHESGLMLRYTVGGSYARTGQKFDTVGTPKYYVHGVAVDMSLAAGVALSSGFAVHGTALFWRALKPKAKGDFAGLSAEIDISDTSLTNFGVGGGFTAWTNSNLYFSLSAVASILRVEVREQRSDTKWGIGGEVLIGKEWWLGHNVGIGVAAAGTFHYIPDKKLEDAKGLIGYSFGPRLSLTFN